MQVEAFKPEQPLQLGRLVADLQADGIISAELAQHLLASTRNQEQAAQHPLSYIASQQLTASNHKPLTIERLLDWLGGHCQQPHYNIDPLKINVPAVTEVMSYQFAQRHGILAVAVSRDEVVIASAQPYMRGWMADLEHVLRRPIKRVLVDPDDLKRYTVEFYSLARSVRGASTGETGGNVGVGNLEQMVELGELKDPDANDQHIVNIVDWLFQYAFDQRASDIHIEPRRDIAHVRFRIDGVLYNVYEFPAQVGVAVTSRLKILGRLNVAEKRKPQDGRIKTKTPEGSEVELRLSTLPTAFGEKMVMRIFDPEVLLRSFDELGLGDEDYKRWRGMIEKPNGIVLVTGPTGSGKTTTLYSSLKKLATSEVNVCTIEDPIEMVEERFNQMQVQHNIDLDFASGVRALMRQDPDIIMVGEIRDLETAEMAIQAALTGHLVLSTLHTNDAPSAITRLLELGVPAYLLKATLLGVMAQRLVRTLCPDCKEPDSIDEKAWQQLTTPWKAALPKQIFKPVGCLECRNTGYKGRQGLYEILPLSDDIQDLLDGDISIRNIRNQGIREGMHTLRLSGAQKVAAGMTTVAEVMRVAPPPQDK
ncbi:GspE/PulE family protein [Dasania sp. GY-MA-18]|uniref:GspE/PulE family protein n=1 Tax=Dasania phycosphaerae TaxID=2950436 RepID=A0A9J6RIL9_9GAMM|nr:MULTISPECIES: GspE/PulE family protein [Dasania]MCR8922106.1 GspE/PulE family protein [Dasania sp. GY-MA-18]MCZ0864534.1 GspE/PulE family protein [Dasania phycosphaerae]MCZ0868262.1 GspE/PulE family protein [Dasania phycosphaerae]